MSNIIGNVFLTNLIQLLDLVALLSVLLCSTFVLLSNAEQVINKFQGTFYAPMFYISLMVLMCAGLSFIIMAVRVTDEDELPSETAKGVRL